MRSVPVKVNETVDARDRARLEGQAGDILALLRLRARTNAELAHISLKYTARLSEVREHLAKTTGEQLVAERKERGVWVYRIASAPAKGQLDLIPRAS